MVEVGSVLGVIEISAGLTVFAEMKIAVDVGGVLDEWTVEEVGTNSK